MSTAELVRNGAIDAASFEGNFKDMLPEIPAKRRMGLR